MGLLLVIAEVLLLPSSLRLVSAHCPGAGLLTPETRVVPLVRREDGGAAAIDKRRNQKNVVVYVNTRERSIGIEGDILLEEPGSDVGVSIDGETVAAHHHHLISA